jgi:hypothetical protein
MYFYFGRLKTVLLDLAEFSSPGLYFDDAYQALEPDLLPTRSLAIHAQGVCSHYGCPTSESFATSLNLPCGVTTNPANVTISINCLSPTCSNRRQDFLKPFTATANGKFIMSIRAKNRGTSARMMT